MDSNRDLDELLERARGGDRAAFERLTESVRSRLGGFVSRRLGEGLARRVELDDVVQETFLRAFHGVAGYRSAGADGFFGWLCGIANNVLRETARRHRKDLLVALDDAVPAETPSASTTGQREERFDRLQGALDSLSPDHRRVIALARLERLPMAEVARRMGRSTEAATQLLWRALKKLREAFGSTDSFHLPDRRLNVSSEDDR